MPKMTHGPLGLSAPNHGSHLIAEAGGMGSEREAIGLGP
jgi:hypothetical protein